MSELGVHRRLAAILAADVVGYSRLMGEDETATLVALKAHREEVIEPKVAAHEGRIVKLMGDGVLAEFASVLEAVRCAIEVQRAMAERNADVPEARQVQFRIGVNLGDVVSEDDDIYGDGINVAARLEALAEPGGICLSSMVHVQIQNKVDVGFRDLGEKELKNIAYPVHVFSVLLDGEVTPIPERVKQRHKVTFGQLAGFVFVVLVLVAGGVTLWLRPWEPDVEPASVERMAFPLPDKPSIAVLPFENLGDDPEQEYFTDGITNDIITDLSKFKNVFVIASNSTFTYKGKLVKVQQVAEELGVRYILEGSVQRTSERVRINAQLIDATTGKHLWAERYDRDTQNLFAIQDEIIETIVATLTFKIDAVERESVFRKDTESLEAYDYYLRGRDIWFGFTKETNGEAGELFEKAIELDPNYARAYGFLTWVHMNDWRYGWSDDPDTSMELALEMAQKASALAPDDYESHWNLGFVYLYRQEFDRAEAEYERALALNPNDADFLVEMAEALVYVGRPEDAIAQIKKAMRLNPHFPEWHFWTLGWAYLVAGRDEEALATLRRMNNPSPGVHKTMARIYVRLGRLQEARAEIAEFLKKEPDATLESDKRQPYKDQAQLNQMLEELRKAGLPEHLPLSLPDKPSIAVLPFDNLSGDPEQEYFSDGMTDDLITDLSKISGLFVIARNSSFSYKGQQVKVRQLAEELGVRYVLEGSVRRAGNEVRINAQLIDATTGGHLWAERYDGTLEDIFDLQDRVTQQIVAALAVSLTGEEQVRQARHDTENAAAHDAYLQGWAHYKLLTPEDFAKSVPFFEEAIRLDPKYAQAHAALASLYWEVYQNDWGFDLNMPSLRAEQFANTHLEEALKNPTPLAHAVQARMLASWGFYDDAVLETQKAVALDENDATALAGLADALIKASRPAEGLDYIERAIRLDPHHPPSYLIIFGGAQFGMEQFEEAAATFERAIKRNPDNEIPFIYLASAYGHLGRIEDADDTIEEANDLRNLLGLGELSLRDNRAYSEDPFDSEFDFPRFGAKPAQDLVRTGLTDIPALKWQYLVTVHRIFGAGNTWFEVEGATKIDIATAKSFHDRGVVFIDVSTESNWNAAHIPGAVHLQRDRTADPSRMRISKTTLREVAQNSDEIVLYDSDYGTIPAWTIAKAVNWEYQKVYSFRGGAQAWKDAGYPVETGQ